MFSVDGPPDRPTLHLVSVPKADEERDLDRETTLDAGLTTATGQTPAVSLV
jgi:hypothetical protein